MKSRLHVENLEGRDCPAAGSSLQTIGVGVDYTLSLNTYGRVASMQLAAPDWINWAEGNVSNAQAQAMTQRIYQHFGDEFDFIIFANNLPDVLPQAQYFGVNMGVKNDTLGIGTPLFNDTALWGSRGRLQSVVHVTSELDLYSRTSLHELVHRDGNFLQQLQSVVPGHWGFSGVGGQLGGWAPGTLNTLVPGVPGLYEADGPNGRPYFYTAFADIEDGDIPYADLELYLLGLIDANQLPDLQYANNAGYVNFAQGIFAADSVQTLTWQNIVAQEGLRTPGPLSSQKDFRVLTVVMTPNPLTQAELDRFDTDVEYFGKPGPDPNANILNFWEATGGRARLTMDGLQNYLPSPHPGVLAVGTGGSTLVGFQATTAGVYNTSQVIRPDLSAFVGSTFTDIRTAVGDVNGDNIQDFAVTSGAGPQTKFAVVSGDLTRYIIAPTFPFPGSEDFTGGAFVSVGDLDGDGRDDVVVTPDETGGPRVIAYSLKPTTGVYVIANFMGINDPNFRGGARTAVGDMNNDGKRDLAVAAGFGGGPRVAVYNGATLFTTRTRLVNDFFAFPGADAARLRNGVYLAIGDVNGDSFGDLVVGGGPGGAPRITVLSGARMMVNLGTAITTPLANFFVAGDTNDRGGVRVATKDTDGDRFAEIVAASGEGSQSRVRVYRGSSVTANGEPRVFQDIDPFNAVLPDGVFVG